MILPPAHRAFALRLPANPMRLAERDIDACTHVGRMPGDMGYEPDTRPTAAARTAPPRRRSASSQSMEAVRRQFDDVDRVD